MTVGPAAIRGIDGIHIAVKNTGTSIDILRVGRVRRIELRSHRKGAAAQKMSGAFGVADAAQSGRSVAWEAGVTRSTPKSSPSTGSQGRGAQAESPPAWAGQMRRDAANRTYRHAAVQSLKEGDRGGASATPDIKDKDD